MKERLKVFMVLMLTISTISCSDSKNISNSKKHLSNTKKTEPIEDVKKPNYLTVGPDPQLIEGQKSKGKLVDYQPLLLKLEKMIERKECVYIAFLFDIDNDKTGSKIFAEVYSQANSTIFFMRRNVCENPEELAIWCRPESKEKWLKSIKSIAKLHGMDQIDIEIYD